jgi:hypothetical protein
MKTYQIHNAWGTIVEFDNPMDFFSVDQKVWRDMIYDRKLIVFKRMNFKLIDYMKFAYAFGDPWSAEDYRYSREKPVLVNENDKTYVTSEFSNKIVSTSRIGFIEMPWHADIPNRQVKPFPHRSLWIVKNPNPENSGKTKWLNINLRDCKQYLTDELVDLIPRVTLTQQSWYSEGTDIQTHSFVKTHPVTGETSLRLNYYNDLSKGITNAWIKEVFIDGVKQADCSLIQKFIDCLLQEPSMVYYHQWDDYDIALYDNYPFIHGRTPLKLNTQEGIAERKFYRTNIDHVV